MQESLPLNLYTDRNASPTLLVIFDGFGVRSTMNGNAIAQARMPCYEQCRQIYPSTTLQAAGSAVGLPEGFIGNSEVGHRTIGAGRSVPTVLQKFHQAIDSGQFSSHPVARACFEKIRRSNSRLHLIGLLSDAGVHSHEKHLYALLDFAHAAGITQIFVHPILDGRDSPPMSAQTYLSKLETYCIQKGYGIVASIQGRFYAMDRDSNWQRTEESYTMLTGGTACEPTSTNACTILASYYEQGVTDEFIPPTHISPQGVIREGDGIFFFNFRADRARQLAVSFLNPEFTAFPTKKLTVIDETLSAVLMTTLFQPEFAQWGGQELFSQEKVNNTLLDEISTQLVVEACPSPIFVIAETEKYAHVTYFFRGEQKHPLKGVVEVLVPSRKERTYEEHPEMSAQGITETVIASLTVNTAHFYLINYANADMVGHSGNLQATIIACEVLDKQLQQLYDEVVVKRGGTIFLTSDHGHAEEMLDEKGAQLTAHTVNPVPCIIIGERYRHMKIEQDSALSLANIAPTVLQHLGLVIPPQMVEKTLI